MAGKAEFQPWSISLGSFGRRVCAGPSLVPAYLVAGLHQLAVATVGIILGRAARWATVRRASGRWPHIH